jgi:RNA-directed DNA polymerase
MKTNNSKEKVRQLQNKLYLTAKKCSTRRFHALYDKVYRDDVLFEAWKRVKANQGSSGVDGIRIEDIEAYGIEKYLIEIQKELMLGEYIPKPVKRVMIPKPDGSERPLGIPTVRDRIVQMATKIAIEPVFEADFKDCSYGFRPKRSAKQALEVVRKACNNKGYYVVDADIEKFYDRVSQDKLMKLLEQRVSDRRILKLIRQWLKAGILYGNMLEVSELGTSQGSVISPLLANIYLNTFDRLWEKYGLAHGKMVRYADDCAIICKNKKSANHALSLMKYIMGKLDLTLNPTKTKTVSMWGGKEGFDFLGIHHRRFTKKKRNGKPFGETYQYPSKKAMKKMKSVIKENINQRNKLPKSEEELIQVMNPKIVGWRNYYKTKNDGKWLRAIDWYILCTFTRWYNKKHQNSRSLKGLYKIKLKLVDKGLQQMIA